MAGEHGASGRVGGVGAHGTLGAARRRPGHALFEPDDDHVAGNN
ncbi:hypothetical protein [Streptomyces cyaneofuscatus]